MKGTPREVTYKHKLHLKVCEECKSIGFGELPEFNPDAGKRNGWNGYRLDADDKHMEIGVASAGGETHIVEMEKTFVGIFVKKL